MKAIKGENVTLDCSATGVPSPIIRWIEIDANSSEHILVQKGPTMVSYNCYLIELIILTNYDSKN
jgi:hypothetical protein